MDTVVKNKVALIISMTIIGVATLFIIIASVLAFMPVQVIKANQQPYKVITTSIKAGDLVTYVADVCKYKEAGSIVSRVFIDANNIHYALPDQDSNVPSGCHQNKVTLPTPINLHPGTWYLALDVEYKVNILRTETYHLRTETFIVTQ